MYLMQMRVGGIGSVAAVISTTSSPRWPTRWGRTTICFHAVSFKRAQGTDEMRCILQQEKMDEIVQIGNVFHLSLRVNYYMREAFFWKIDFS